MCLPDAYICDNHADCQGGDDEYFCKPQLPPCPKHCSCLLYVLSCLVRKSTPLSFPTLLPHLVIMIANISMPDLNHLTKYLLNPIILKLPGNDIQDFCIPSGRYSFMYYLSILDISLNEILVLKFGCFSRMTHLLHLNISHNKVSAIKGSAFKGAQNLSLIDISFNNLTHFSKDIFSEGPKTLKFLNITGNSYIQFNPEVFSSIQIKEIVTDRFEICCITLTVCKKIPYWPHSCGNLIKPKVMVCVFICEGLIGMILHILLHVFTDSATGKLYYRFVKCLSFSDILFCVALLALAFSDMNFGFSYPIYDSYWRKCFTCYCVSVLVYIGTTFSVWSISFIALIRYYMVEKPLEARYKNPYVWKFCICVVLSFVSAIGLALLSKFVAPEGQLPTRLCLLFGGTDVLSTIASSIVIALQLFAAILVPTAYTLLTITVLNQRLAMSSL